MWRNRFVRKPGGEIVGGLLVIAAGLVRRASVFLGDFSIVAVVFDAIGAYFVVHGCVRLLRTRLGAAAPPSAPPNA